MKYLSAKSALNTKKKKKKIPLEQKNVTRVIRQTLNQIFKIGSILMVVLQFGLAVVSSCIPVAVPVGNVSQPDPTQALYCQRSF